MTVLATVVPKAEAPLAPVVEAYGEWFFVALVLVLIGCNVVLYVLGRSTHKRGIEHFDRATEAYKAAKIFYDQTLATLKAWDSPACAWCGFARDWSKVTFFSQIAEHEIRVLVEHLPDNTVKATCIECKWAPDLVGKSAEGADSYKAHDALRAVLRAAVMS